MPDSSYLRKKTIHQGYEHYKENWILKNWIKKKRKEEKKSILQAFKKNKKQKKKKLWNTYLTNSRSPGLFNI